MLQELLTQPKTIRHIQRGKISTNTASDPSGSATLAGFTDLSKMFVLINGSSYKGSGVYANVYLNEITLNSISFLPNIGGSLSYQVIETY